MYVASHVTRYARCLSKRDSAVKEMKGAEAEASKSRKKAAVLQAALDDRDAGEGRLEASIDEVSGSKSRSKVFATDSDFVFNAANTTSRATRCARPRLKGSGMMSKSSRGRR